MAQIKTADRVYQTSTTTGTGDYTLDAAPTGFRAFNVIGAGNTCPYFATDGTNWEVGIGTYVASPDRLQRTAILASSNAGSAVNWGVGTRDIKLGMPAQFACSPVVPRSSNTILGVADWGSDIEATGTFTQTLTAAATLGNGWYVDYHNAGTGIITFGTNIDGVTLKLYPGESCRISSDGSAFQSRFRSTGPVLVVPKTTVTGAAQADITTPALGDFDHITIDILDVTPQTDNTALYLRVSEDSGSTFKSGGTDYAYGRYYLPDASAFTSSGSTGAGQILLADLLGNGAAKPFCGVLDLFNQAGTTKHKACRFKATYEPSANTLFTLDSGGLFKLDTNAINALRFLMSSGNITITYAVYGWRK